MLTVRGPGLKAFACITAVQAGQLVWNETTVSGDLSVLRPSDEPFSVKGGLKVLSGNLGRSVINVSAVPEDRHVIEAPARVFDSQEALHQAFKVRELDRDVTCIVRWQDLRANGMPELDKFTPPPVFLFNL